MSPVRIRAGLAALAALALGSPAAVLAAHPVAVTLRDAQGNPVASGSTVPYSPGRSCGGCHDVALITQGYHFQQGRTDGAARIQVSDAFAGALGSRAGVHAEDVAAGRRELARRALRVRGDEPGGIGHRQHCSFASARR